MKDSESHLELFYYLKTRWPKLNNLFVLSKYKYKIKKKKQFEYCVYIKLFEIAYSITVTSSLTKNSTFSSSTFFLSESSSSVSISEINKSQ